MEENQEVSREEKLEWLKEQNGKEKNSKKRKVILKVVLVLLLVCALLALWINRQKILPENAYEKIQFSLADREAGEGYPLALKGNKELDRGFLCREGRIAILTDTSFQVINQKGNVLIETQNSYAMPSLAASEMRFLLYDLGGTQYKIESIEGTVLEGEFKEKIISADISNQGKYVLATESPSHLCELSVYMEDGSLQYNYKFSACYVTDVSISEDGKSGAVCGIYNENGVMQTEIYLFDFGSPEPVAVYRAENTVFFDVEYSDSGVIGVGSGSTVFLGTDGRKQKVYDYNEDLIAFDIGFGGAALVFASSEKSDNSDLKVFSSSGEEILSAKVDNEVRDVSLYGEAVAFLSKLGMQVLSTVDGSQIGNAETHTGAKRVELCDVNSAYVLSLSHVEYFQF